MEYNTTIFWIPFSDCKSSNYIGSFKFSFEKYQLNSDRASCSHLNLFQRHYIARHSLPLNIWRSTSSISQQYWGVWLLESVQRSVTKQCNNRCSYNCCPAQHSPYHLLPIMLQSFNFICFFKFYTLT